MKKRVAIIVNGGVGGGFFNQGIPSLMTLIRNLSDEFEITVYSLTEIKNSYSNESFTVKSFPNKSYYPKGFLFFKLFMTIFSDHLKRPFHLVHGFWGFPSGTLAVCFSKAVNIPSLVSLQGSETAAVKKIGYGLMLNSFKRRILFSTLSHADAVTVLTRFQADKLKDYGVNRQVQIISYGADNTIFRPAVKVYSGTIRFIHVANLTEVKDQETLLRTFALIRKELDCKLRIIGADFMEGKIQILANELDLTANVEFTGVIKHTELTHHFEWAHAMIHTSFYEAQGVVLAEAAESKILICGTEVGLIYDLREFAVSASVGDYLTLSGKIIDTFRNRIIRSEKVENAYEWSQTHSHHDTFNGFKKIYDNL